MTQLNASLVRLYYLGGLGHPSRKLTIVRSRGKVYTLPPVGEAIEVPSFIASDLIARHKVDIPREGRFEAFTLDHRIAKRVKEAGDLKVQNAAFVGQKSTKITTDDVLSQFSKEDLEMMLAEKMSDVDDTEENAVKSKKNTPATKSPAKKKVVKKAAPKTSVVKSDSDENKVMEASETKQSSKDEPDDFEIEDDEEEDE